MAVEFSGAGRIQGPAVELLTKMFHVKRFLVQENETRMMLIGEG
jgi:hypothetical protein